MSITNPQSFNRYSYVHNDPVNLIDPSGLDERWCFGYWVLINGENTGIFISVYCWVTKDPNPNGSGGGGNGGGGGGGSNAVTRSPQNRMPREVEAEACVASVVGHYLGNEALTLLKQAALNAGMGLAAAAAVFFLGEAAGGATGATFVDIGLSGFAKAHSLMSGITYALGGLTLAVKLYPKLAKESFNNKKEAVKALKACF